MLKALMAVALGGLGAFAGGYIGLAELDRTTLEKRSISITNVERVANYSLYGAIGLPSGVLLINGIWVAASDREFQRRLQNKGVKAVERLGFGGDVGVAVSEALDQIKR